MSFLFEEFFGVLELPEPGSEEDEILVHALGSWENEVTVTTPEDIGRLTAMIVLSEEPIFADEVVFVAGETLSYGRLAEIVENVTGSSVKKHVWTVEFLKKELEMDPESVALQYRVAFAEGKGVSWPKEGTFNGLRGIEVMDIETFAKKKLA